MFPFFGTCKTQSFWLAMSLMHVGKILFGMLSAKYLDFGHISGGKEDQIERTDQDNYILTG